MPTLAKSDSRQLENEVRNISSASVYQQPSWHGFENNCMPAPVETINGSVSPGNAHSQSNGEGATKVRETREALLSGSKGNGGQEQQHLKHVSPSAVPLNGHLDTTSQMELVGHSIILTSYPYSNPQYGAMMAFEAPMHTQFLGMHHTRVPLPLQMEEEPVYVNAKQYHGILRRRQSRAKAEMTKKIIKDRKPYLHESRHQHAMRRSRGSGGRFVNTKKQEDDGSKSTSNERKNCRAAASTHPGNSLSSELLGPDSLGNSDQLGAKESKVQDEHKQQAHSDGNSNGHRISSLYYPQSSGSEQGRHLSWSLLVNQATHGAASSN